MKYFIVIAFLMFSTKALSDSLEGLVSAFVHLRCFEKRQDALLVLENNSPYTLVVKANRQINRDTVHPSVFSVYDAELLNSYKLGEGASKDILVKTLYDSFPELESESFELSAFEKASWFLSDFLTYYQLDSRRDYLLKISGFGLDFSIDKGDHEYVVINSNYHLIQESCFQ